MNEAAMEAMKMLRELVEKAGMTAEEALPFVCQHIATEGLIHFVFAVAALLITSVGFVYGLIRLWKWALPRLNHESESAFVAFVVSLIAGFPAFGGIMYGLGYAAAVSFAQWQAPLGYLVRASVGV